MEHALAALGIYFSACGASPSAPALGPPKVCLGPRVVGVVPSNLLVHEVVVSLGGGVGTAGARVDCGGPGAQKP